MSKRKSAIHLEDIPAEMLAHCAIYFDAKIIGVASVSSRALCAACDYGGLWRSLALARFPILRPLSNFIPPTSFKEQYKKQATHKDLLAAPAALPTTNLKLNDFAFR